MKATAKVMVRIDKRCCLLSIKAMASYIPSFAIILLKAKPVQFAVTTSNNISHLESPQLQKICMWKNYFLWWSPSYVFTPETRYKCIAKIV